MALNAYQKGENIMQKCRVRVSCHSGFGYFISFDIYNCIAKLYWNDYGLALAAPWVTLLHIDTSYHWERIIVSENKEQEEKSCYICLLVKIKTKKLLWKWWNKDEDEM